ncbi:50S ribosomal protein L18 [Pullulanibacillus camelliae]|uniref:Large ribosomal subunit protein uL18 n=1 Tax=Pullulanibacillus camelliae TaxID=1707096 RepID=A0A8J3E1N4_9BACL|nr:50S ribosomal protein L18 [Pullulanibacillus camelliae]GGE54506.1 50S ribosomal protein L18 [Pullulanibacillus camelliae]
MITKPNKNAIRKRRHKHIRRRVAGTAVRPRLNVYRSSKHIYAQVINDETSETLVAASSLDKEVGLEKGSDIEAAKKVGALVAKRALEKGVKEIVFDRGGYLYHGRVKALADAAREAGLTF